MNYISTRGHAAAVSAAEAIKMGIAPDGGLFVPQQKFQLDWEKWLAEPERIRYQAIALEVLQKLLTDFTAPELEQCIAQAYNPEKFDDPEITPLRRLDPKTFLLELWHGPTSAFKDLALQMLPQLLTRSLQKTGEKDEVIILVATSGDTGKAALEGFRDVAGTRVVVFYPEAGVSLVQKQQMVTQEGRNLAVVAVSGNFDDAQSGVKRIFGDAAINLRLQQKQLRLSSANSINWGRLAPQIVYYVYAYLRLVGQGQINPGEKVNVVVPTGNFGNILAAFYARAAGVPLGRLICAANANNVLTDFFATGEYDRRRTFYRTISPSMDILLSSNLERLLFELSGHDNVQVAALMQQLSEQGSYRIEPDLHRKLGQIFWSASATDAETMTTIRSTYLKYKQVVDTHTAVGLQVLEQYRARMDDPTPVIVASTASPFKFCASVLQALFPEKSGGKEDELGQLAVLSSRCGIEIPRGLRELAAKPVLHHRTVSPEGMSSIIESLLPLAVS